MLCDINEGFPEEFHGRFDVVHVRLLVLGLQVEQFTKAVGNVVKLLKPGGYLQWTDLDFQNTIKRVYPDGAIEVLQEEGDMILQFFRERNWSTNVVAKVSGALEKSAVEMEIVRVTDYGDAVYEKEELRATVLEWQKQSIGGIFPLVLKKKGMSEEEVERVVGEHVRRLEEFAAKGVTSLMPFVTLVARRR